MREVRAWMVRTGHTYATLAKRLGISRSYLVNIVAGRRTCSLAVAVRWMDISGLPASLFVALRRDEDEE